VDQWNKECRCLSSTGISDTDNVMAFQLQWNRFVLNRSRVYISFFCDCRFQSFVDFEIVECMFRSEYRCLFRNDRFIDESRDIDTCTTSAISAA